MAAPEAEVARTKARAVVTLELKRRNPCGSRLLIKTGKLLGALINPRAQQADLIGRDRADVRPVMERRHPIITVLAQMRDCLDEHAFGTVTGDDDLAVLAAFERAFEAVELQVAPGLVAAVALGARVVQNGFDVACVSHALLGGCGWQGARHGIIIGGRGQGQSQRDGQNGGESDPSLNFHGFAYFPDNLNLRCANGKKVSIKKHFCRRPACGGAVTGLTLSPWTAINSPMPRSWCWGMARSKTPFPPRPSGSTPRNCAAGTFLPKSARRSGNRNRKSKRSWRTCPHAACISRRSLSAKVISATT